MTNQDIIKASNTVLGFERCSGGKGLGAVYKNNTIVQMGMSKDIKKVVPDMAYSYDLIGAAVANELIIDNLPKCSTEPHARISIIRKIKELDRDAPKERMLDYLYNSERIETATGHNDDDLGDWYKGRIILTGAEGDRLVDAVLFIDSDRPVRHPEASFFAIDAEDAKATFYLTLKLDHLMNNIDNLSEAYKLHGHNKVPRMMLKLAELLRARGITGRVKNLNNRRVPHVVVNVDGVNYSAVYFGNEKIWRVFNGYGKTTTWCWEFKQYAYVARFIESFCEDESEAMNSYPWGGKKK